MKEGDKLHKPKPTTPRPIHPPPSIRPPVLDSVPRPKPTPNPKPRDFVKVSEELSENVLPNIIINNLRSYSILIDSEGVFRVRYKEDTTCYADAINNQYLVPRTNKFFFDSRGYLRIQFWALPRKSFDGFKFV